MQPVRPVRNSISRKTGKAKTLPGRRNNLLGFTLIELMIVIAILAVLVGLAYPAYTEHVRKARRADAISSMMATAQYLERCFTQTNSYTGCTQPAGDAADGYYDISMTVYTATTYTIQAEPQGSQATDPCGTFTLDYLGNKTPVPGNNRCWGSSS